MKAFYDDGIVRLFHGHVIDVLRSLPDESVNCCITSPPYWGLRAYGTEPQVWGGDPKCEHDWMDTSYRDSRKTDTTAGEKQRTNSGATGWRDAVRQNATCLHCDAWSGEFGLEPTPQMFVEHAVLVFREVRRVLCADGTLWLNFGDSYATGAGKVGGCPGGGDQGERFKEAWKPHSQVPDGKSPNANIPRYQPNRMPIEGLKPKDLIGVPWRVAFALQADGWWLRSDIIWAKPAPMPESVTDRPTRSHEYIFLLAKSERYFYDAEAIKEPCSPDTNARYARGRSESHKWADGGPGNQSIAKSFDHMKSRKMAAVGSGVKNNPSFDAAMAVMPDTRNKRDVWTVNTEPFPDAHFATFPPNLILPCVLAGCPVGGTILDPFSGAATTALVAKENGRLAIGSELNEEYLTISARRLAQEVLAL